MRQWPKYDDGLTGADLRAVAKSGEPVMLALIHGNRYWLIPWTDREEMLELADELERCEKEHGEEGNVLAIERLGDESQLVINVDAVRPQKRQS